MHSTTAIALAIFYVVAVVADPITERHSSIKSASFKWHTRPAVAARDLVRSDQARAWSLLPIGSKTGSASIINEVTSFVASTKIGSQTFNLLVDTGSANTWVGPQAAQPYIPGPTSHNTMRSVSFVYGSGNFSGTEYTDNVALGDVTVHQQSIGYASSQFGFDGFDGIIGFGPDDLTQGTVSGLDTVPTFMQNLVTQHVISKNVLGVYYRPEHGTDTADVNGVLTFGGADKTKYTGAITYTPRTQVLPYARWYGIDVQATSYGSTSLSGGYSTLVDTGTTLILIPDAIYQKFLNVSGGTYDPNYGLASFTTKPTKNFSFKINGVNLALTPDEWLVPSTQTALFGLPTDKYWSWIATLGTGPTQDNVKAVLGMKFFETYYTIYDAEQNRVGFAKRS